jgi:hypothetical protein
MSSSVKEELASLNPGKKKPLKDVGRGHYEIWPIIPHSRKQLGKSSVHKICSKESHLNYLFNKLSSDMKDCQDNEAVQFEFEFTLHLALRCTLHMTLQPAGYS